MSDVRTCPQCGRTYGGDDRFCTVDGAALVSSGGASLIGTVVADRFLVKQKLGEGGMGEVYLAEHVRMKRKVALKLMRPWMLGDPVAVGRFHREAENASQISHPNVAQVYDFGETSDRIVYLAMEFVDGEPLSKILDREGRLHTVRTAEVVRQTGEALTAAHTMGILHRDLKPDNVMVGRSRSGTDIIKLVDFGIARAMHRGTQQFTSTGLVVGTPDYMSPEQLSGDELDGRSDLYALALMAFRMLTGTGAYPEGSSGEAMIARLTSTPRRLDAALPGMEWPESLQLAFNKALAPNPNDRFTDAMEFVAELDAAVSAMPLGADEQAYLVQLSQRHTPARSGIIPTPTAATQALGAQSAPASALMTPPAMPRVVTQPMEALANLPDPVVEDDALESEVEETVEPVEQEEEAAVSLSVPDAPPVPVQRPGRKLGPMPLVAGGVAVVAVVGYLLSRGGGGTTLPPSGASSLDSAPVVGAASSSAVTTPAPDTSAAAPAATGPSDSLLATARRATFAVSSSAGQGAAVLVDSSGLALTTASLVPDDSVVTVFVSRDRPIKATVLTINRTSNVATLLLPRSRLSRWSIVTPGSDPAAGDSVLVLPGSGRGIASKATDAAVSAVDARSISLTALPSAATGAPVLHRASQRLVALGGRRAVPPSALRAALEEGQRAAKGKTASEVEVAVVPDAAFSSALLGEDAMARVRSEIERYTFRKDGITVLVMTPQVMKYRADRDAAGANPMNISGPLPPPDPIRAWTPFGNYVSRRRVAVMLNASVSDAAFPTWPTKEITFRRDIRSIRLLRNDSLVTSVESGTYRGLQTNGSKPILNSAIAVYAPGEFRAGDKFRVEVTDGNGGTVTLNIPVGTLEVIRSDLQLK